MLQYIQKSEIHSQMEKNLITKMEKRMEVNERTNYEVILPYNARQETNES